MTGKQGKEEEKLERDEMSSWAEKSLKQK